MSVRYQRVVWHHDHADEPVVLWAEIGDDDFECRKVDEYQDGRLAYADDDTEMGLTRLGDQAVPSVEQINDDEEFTAVEIDRADFELAWQRAIQR